MKNIIKSVALALALVLFAVAFTGCDAKGNKSEVNKAVAKLESALRSRDVDQLLDCYDPNVTAPIKGAIKLLGVETEQISELITNALGKDLMKSLESYGEPMEKADEAVSNLFESIRIKPVGHAFNEAGDRCTVTVKYEGTINDSPVSLDGKLNCVLKGEAWYIAIL